MSVDDVIAALVSIWMILAAAYFRPSHAACPTGWHHNGIQPSGEFSCVRAPQGDGVPAGTLRSRIHCTGGTVPIVVNERSVGCHRVSR